MIDQISKFTKSNDRAVWRVIKRWHDHWVELHSRVLHVPVDTKLLVKTLLVSFNRNILPGILFINSTFANIFLFEKCIVILNQTLSAKIDIGKYWNMIQCKLFGLLGQMFIEIITTLKCELLQYSLKLKTCIASKYCLFRLKWTKDYKKMKCT